MTWVERKTITYEIDNLPFDDNGRVLIGDLSTIRVQTIGFKHPVDFGSWCYTERKKLRPTINDERCSIVSTKVSSFRIHRTDFIKRYLEFLSVYSIGKTRRTISSAIIYFQSFVKWCDLNNPEALDSIETIPSAFSKYTDELMHNVRTSLLNVNTAAKSQITTMKAIQWMYDDKYGKLLEGIRRIRRSTAATNPTSPPSEKNAQNSLEIYQNIFNCFASFVTQFGHYPTKLQLPHKDFWIFPNVVMYPPNSKVNHLFAYNYKDGRLNSLEEIINNFHRKTPNKPLQEINRRYRAEKILRRAEKRMERANTNRYHIRRIHLATLAQQCFIMLFSAQTGMGITQISNLRWSKGDYKISNETQSFKTIKKRAKGRNVEFLISPSFIPAFNKYLELRNYLLKSSPNISTDYLFFSINSKGKLGKTSQELCGNLKQRLKKNFKINSLVSFRQWRAYKSDWLIKNTDLATTATILQNTPNTVLKHYIAGSESNAVSELTAYYETFNTKIINQTESSTPISIGQCISLNSPNPLNTNPPFKPNCSKKEGCLFCKNYAIHADTTDYKKLLSYKYVIEQTRHLAASEEHYQKIFDPVFSRIKSTISVIKKSNLVAPQVLKQTKQDVYEHEQLDPYWSRKLQLLIDLDLLT